MISIVIVLLVGLTSLFGYVIGARKLNLRGTHLRWAVRRLLEGLGLAVIFFAANLSGWIVAILAIRTFTGWFVSVYLFNDVTVGALSLLQGLTFQWWLESSTPGSPRESGIAPRTSSSF